MRLVKHLFIEGGIMTFIAFLLYCSLGHKILLFDEVQNLILDNIAINTNDTASNERVKDVVCVTINDSLVRSDILPILQQILDSKPAVVGIDIDFKTPTYSPVDTLLEKLILENKSKIVLSYDWDENGLDSYSYFIKDYKAYPYLGHVHAVNIGGMERFIKLEDRNRPSFVTLLSKLYNGKELNDVDNQCLLINYKHEPTLIQSDRLSYQASRDILKNKIVIVGVDQGTDIHNTPLGLKYGYFVHFHALKSLLEYEFSFFYRYCFPVIFIFISACILFLVKYFSSNPRIINSLIDLFMFMAVMALYLIYGIFLDVCDYTTSALWSTIPLIAVLTLWIYSVIVIILGKLDKINILTKLAQKNYWKKKPFLDNVSKSVNKGLNRFFDIIKKSYLYED